MANSQTKNEVDAWLNAARVAITSESHLQKVALDDPAAIRVPLLLGNTPPALAETQFESFIRFAGDRSANGPAPQLDAFLSRFEIIDQHANDASGFSATLLRVKDGQIDAGRYTLAFRSTEYKNPITGELGGDYDRDGYFGADGEISSTGFAFAQTLAMERYWNRLLQGIVDIDPTDRTSRNDLEKIDGTLAGRLQAPGTMIDVVGYSLGGNLASTFTALHSDKVNRTFLLNAAGRGVIGSDDNQPTKIRAMLDLFRIVFQNPASAPLPSADDPSYQAATVLRSSAIAEPPWDMGFWFNPDPQSYSSDLPRRNIYTDSARYRYAKDYVLSQTSLQTFPSGLSGGNGGYAGSAGNVPKAIAGFDKITQIFGHANHGDGEATANSGAHAPAISVFIEGQPFISGDGGKKPWNPEFLNADADKREGDFGSTHSLTLIVDSLELMSTIMSIDDSLTKRQVEAIFAGGSKQRAKFLAGATEEGSVEADSLEQVMDAMRRLLIDPSVSATAADTRPGGFGNVDRRTEFYQNLYELKDKIASLKNAEGENISLDIVSLIDESAFEPARGEPLQGAFGQSGSRIASLASIDGDEGLGYRYALAHLNPFSLTATAGTIATYTEEKNALAKYSAASETSRLGMTSNYITARADFLERILYYNVQNAPYDTSGGQDSFDATAFDGDGVIWRDVTTNSVIRRGLSIPANTKYISFGSAQADNLIGGQFDDKLFGGDGEDILNGAGGKNILEGGVGADTYVINSASDFFSFDTILDSDGLGVILYNDQALSGGVKVGHSRYVSADGQINYVFQGDFNSPGTLIINDSIQIQNFRNSDLGITLDPTQPEPEEVEYSTIYFGDHYPIDGPNDDDHLDGSAFNDLYRVAAQETGDGPLIAGLYGGYFNGRAGDDRFLGSDKYDDVAFGGAGNDYLDGQALGENLEFAFSMGDRLYGEGGQDVIFGSRYDDRLYGDFEQVELREINLSLGTYLRLQASEFFSNITSGPGSVAFLTQDRYFVQWHQRTFSTAEAINYLLGIHESVNLETHYNDFIDGGDGSDWIVGGNGSDEILGGSGNDELIGDFARDFYPYGELNINSNTQSAFGPYSYLLGRPGDDYIDGGNGDDIIRDVVGGSDYLLGGEGDDYIINQNRASLEIFFENGEIPEHEYYFDYIDGGTGNDTIESRSFEQSVIESFLVLGGDGDDVIGLDGQLVAYVDGGNGNDVVSVTSLTYWDDVAPSDIEVLGGEGNDQIEAGGRTVAVDGGAGDDDIRVGGLFFIANGGPGNDTIAVGGTGVVLQDESNDSGSDVLEIIDWGSEWNSSGRAVVSREGDDLRLTIPAQDEEEPEDFVDLTVLNWFRESVNQIREIRFFDVTWSVADVNNVLHSQAVSVRGTPGDETLVGTNDDNVIYGGGGVDFLHGGVGADRYVFNLGDGVDYIDDVSGQGNSIAFGPGIADEDLSLGLGSLKINIGLGGDAIHLVNFDPIHAELSGGIDHFIFADASTLTYAQLLSRGIGISGTASSETISGTSVSDRITGMAGDDHLFGHSGHDSLDGGSGNDVLEGGAGSDTYTFASGSGLDTVTEDGVGGNDVDTVRFIDINPSAVSVSRAEDDLVITTDETGDSVRFVNAAIQDVIERVVFSDNTVWNAQALRDQVPPDNMPPSVDVPLPDYTVAEDSVAHFQVAAETFSDPNVGDVLSYSASQDDGSALPTWLSFDTVTRSFNAAPLNGNVGTTRVKVTATDPSGASASDAFDITVTNTNDAPVVAQTLADVAVIEDTPATLHLPPNTFSDEDAGDQLSYAISRTDGNALPAWLSFDSVSGTISGTPGNADTETISLRMTATDLSGAAASDDFDLTVVNSNDAPVLAQPIASQLTAEDAAFSYRVPAGTFTDADAGDVLTYTASLANGSALPGWLTFDASTQTLTGTPRQADVGATTVRVTATDRVGATAQGEFNLTVNNVNDAPVIAAVGGAIGLGQVAAATDLLSGIGDEDGNAITQVSFIDRGTGGGYFTVNGVAKASGTQVTVSAANLATVKYVGAATQSAENVSARVFDGALWSPWVTGSVQSSPHPGVNSAPTIQSVSGSLALNQSVSAISLVQGIADADSDAIRQYSFIDRGAGGGYFTVAGAVKANGTQITVNAADLATVQYVSAATQSFESVSVRANDGLAWSAWVTGSVQSSSHPGVNSAPTVASTGGAVTLGGTLSGASLITGLSDADGDAIQQYSFVDRGTGGGYFTVNGVAKTAGAQFTVTAANLGTVQYVGSSIQSMETISARAFDGLAWSAWSTGSVQSSAHPGNNIAPTITSVGGAVHLSETVAASTLIAGMADADGDAIQKVSLIDRGTGGGYFTVNGVASASGKQITVSAADLATVDYVGASVQSVESVSARVFDGIAWSAWKTGNVQSSAHPGSNAAPTLASVTGSAGLNQSIAASSLITGAADADGDAIRQYGFIDRGTRGGYFTVNGVAKAYNQQFTVAAADLTGVRYVGAPTQASESVYARVNDGLAWSPWVRGIVSSTNGLWVGTEGDDTFVADPLNDVLEGSSGDDVLTGSDDNTLLIGGEGNDTLADGAGNDLLVGGEGDDVIVLGGGDNVILFNAGDGADTLEGGDVGLGDGGQGNALSLGRMNLEDVSLSKNGDDLVLHGAGNDSITLKDWYAGEQIIDKLQFILDSAHGYDAASSDTLHNKQVQTFDFLGLVDEFNAARTASPGLNSWAITNALLQFHLSGADDAALGGDLAYWYAQNGAMTGIGLNSAQAIIGAPNFGAEAQTLRPFSGLQEGLVKLG